MLCSKMVSSLVLLALVNAISADVAAVAPVARFASPLLTGEVLTASAPAFYRAAPLVGSAPLVAPATIGYRTAIPQNIPPFASQVNIFNRALAGYYTVAAPLTAAPIAARVPFAASLAAPVAAPLTAPLATPLAAPVAAALAAPLAAPLPAPVAAPVATSFAAPLFRSPFAYAASPVLPSLPFVRTPIAAPVGLRAAAVPLQTQAIFGPAPVAADVPVSPAVTKLTPVNDPAAENLPQNEDDGFPDTRGALDSNDNGSDDFRPEDPSVVDDDVPEDQPSN